MPKKLDFFFLTAVDCGTLPNPLNGQVSHPSGTTFGQTATYICEQGYTLNEDSSRPNPRICQADGYWSGTSLSCPRKPYCVFVSCTLALDFEYIKVVHGDSDIQSFNLPGRGLFLLWLDK